MSAGKWVRDIARLLPPLLASLVGWLLVTPIAAIVPKHRDWIAVIGRQDGRFLDNAKYFFLQANSTTLNLRIVYITGHREVKEFIAGSSLEAMLFPNIKTAWFLMRCGTVVVDEAAWFRRLRFFLLIRARVIQLWHGVGCKRIEADLWRHEINPFAWVSRQPFLALRLLFYRLTGRRTSYAAVATTSYFYREKVFMPAFSAKHFPITGYPRNDFAQSLDERHRGLAWINMDASIKSKLPDWRRLGHMLVLVTPTFRDSGSVPMQLDSATLLEIDRFAAAHCVEFIFKFHPSERNVDHVSGQHFHVCDRDSDIYPLLPHVAALVTDYSSISMDFLLVNRPLLFLIPDGDDYTRNDRQLQFDPHTMMPGPVAPNWSSLLPKLLTEWSQDGYQQKRAELRCKAFDDLPQAEAVPKMISFMRERGWVNTQGMDIDINQRDVDSP